MEPGQVSDMNCRKFWETGGVHSEHLRECPACAMRFERHRALGDGLRELAAGESHHAAPERVERRLAVAFRTHNGVAGTSAPSIWRPIIAWAAAAAAVIALAMLLVRDRAPKPPERAAPWGQYLALYQENDFITLPNAAQLDPNEETNLVRVELPRATMIAMGYTVSAERAQELVLADVILDAGGQARAVRFVE
jgi:hypothetical protein